MPRMQQLRRLTSKRMTVALSLAACACALSVAPAAAHARTTDIQNTDASVWVVDDITAQSACTAPQGGPCAPGSVQVLNVYHTSLSTAQGAQRHYLHGDARGQDLDAFIQAEAARTHQQYAGGTGSQGVSPRAHTSMQPASSPWMRPLTNYSPSPEGLGSVTLNWGARVTAQFAYNLSGSLVYPMWFAHGVISGQAWDLHSPRYDDGNNNDEGYFGGGNTTCNGIALNNHLGANPGVGVSMSGQHTYALYGDNGQCSSTINAVNWYW